MEEGGHRRFLSKLPGQIKHGAAAHKMTSLIPSWSSRPYVMGAGAEGSVEGGREGTKRERRGSEEGVRRISSGSDGCMREERCSPDLVASQGGIIIPFVCMNSEWMN